MDNYSKKEALKEFSKIVLYICNHSQTKVYLNWIFMVVNYYLWRTNNNLIPYKIEKGTIILDEFDEFLVQMQRAGFIELELNVFGTAIVAMKRLNDSDYEDEQYKILNRLINYDYSQLKTLIDFVAGE